MTLQELVQEASRRGMNLGQLARVLESEETGIPMDEIQARIERMLDVMKRSVEDGLSRPPKISRSGLSGGDAIKMAERVGARRTFPGNELLATICSYALAVSEVNASMGKIVAAPTAGSCGIIPGSLLALARFLSAEGKPRQAGQDGRKDQVGAASFGDSEEEINQLLVDALSAAGLVGQVIGEKVGLAGAQAGCQAECGSAAAMAACGLALMGGGSPEDCIHAAAIALKGLMGLVCDPVAGLVEVPCVKRNATSASVALASAEMALSGIRSRIPPDEVILAMAQVGRMMPESLRETAKGGLAVTPSGLSISEQLARKERKEKPSSSS